MELSEQAVLFTLRNEDYQWDSKAQLEDLQDGAGWTFIGITQKYDGKYLSETHGSNVLGLYKQYKENKEKALAIIKQTYIDKYWKGRSFDKIESPRLAIRLFDLAVNCGFGGLNDIVYRAGLGSKFDSDAINTLIKKQGEEAALIIIKNAALERYKSLRGYNRFGNGWKNRLDKNEFHI